MAVLVLVGLHACVVGLYSCACTNVRLCVYVLVRLFCAGALVRVCTCACLCLFEIARVALKCALLCAFVYAFVCAHVRLHVYAYSCSAILGLPLEVKKSDLRTWFESNMSSFMYKNCVHTQTHAHTAHMHKHTTMQAKTHTHAHPSRCAGSIHVCMHHVLQELN